VIQNKWNTSTSSQKIFELTAGLNEIRATHDLLTHLFRQITDWTSDIIVMSIATREMTLQPAVQEKCGPCDLAGRENSTMKQDDQAG
jgi:hypothetical protein